MEQIRPDRHTEDQSAKNSEVRRLAEYEQVRIKRANKVTTEILGLLGLLRSVGETVGRYYGQGEKTANPEPIKLVDETKLDRDIPGSNKHNEKESEISLGSFEYDQSSVDKLSDNQRELLGEIDPSQSS